MNRLIYNYPGNVTDVVDGRTFDMVLDRGFREYTHRRIQMQNVNIPNPRVEKTDESRVSFEKAKNCLSAILFGWKTSEDGKNGSEFQGRKIVVAPQHPNRYGRAFFRVYVRAERENINYTNLTVKYAGFMFLHVNNLMELMGERDYDLEEVIKIYNTFDLRDF